MAVKPISTEPSCRVNNTSVIASYAYARHQGWYVSDATTTPATNGSSDGTTPTHTFSLLLDHKFNNQWSAGVFYHYVSTMQWFNGTKLSEGYNIVNVRLGKNFRIGQKQASFEIIGQNLSGEYIDCPCKNGIGSGMRDQTKAGSGVRTKRRGFFSRIPRLLFVCLLLTLSFVSQGVHAEEIIVVSSRLNGPHSRAALELESLLKESLPNHLKIRQMSVSDEEPLKVDAGPNDFILTIGTKAFADVVVQNTSTRLIAMLIPEETYHALLHANPRREGKTSAVYIEQPVQRNLELVRVALPGRKPGILLGPQSGTLEHQLNRVSKELNLPLYLKTLKPQENLVTALDQVLKNCNVLIAFADPEVSNPSTDTCC